ncbi:hypothetical protein FDENT_11102 [Fusarium denticulatum]|uniref:Uncharacterized protein n=1 Tax=Fusarium denticulatum TaxID=48507 RepID=A0A8H5TK29_9HYPO|nr:hypothetical protein FDENT_11102 [Fusarium denticulatum]
MFGPIPEIIAPGVTDPDDPDQDHEGDTMVIPSAFSFEFRALIVLGAHKRSCIQLSNQMPAKYLSPVLLAIRLARPAIAMSLSFRMSDRFQYTFQNTSEGEVEVHCEVGICEI